MGAAASDLDSLHVLEQIMEHFYLRGMALKSKGAKAELIDASLLQAAAIAEKVAPYRHPRMGPLKIATDPKSDDKIPDDMTADEIRAHFMQRLADMNESGLIDLQALPAPSNRIANSGPHGGAACDAGASAKRRNIHGDTRIDVTTKPTRLAGALPALAM
jgi:hypothetical protein